MKKVIKSMVVLGILATTTQVLPMNIAKANEKDTKAVRATVSYDVTVPTLGDVETTLVMASTNANAVNKVNYIEKGKLTSWLEDEKGKNCSSKSTYSSTGSYNMSYNSNRPQKVKLNIGTSTSTWGKVATKGIFNS